MKNIFHLLIFICLNTFSQSKFLTKSGAVNFEASVPSFEEVAAKNNSVTAIVNTENGELAALILVKGFRFKNALMEEHFNENYAESDSYPKASFKGKINGFSINTYKKGINYTISGSLSFHGKTKNLENIPIMLSLEEELVKIVGDFKVNVSDFDIKIPKVVRNKVSQLVHVSFNFAMKKKK